MRAVSSSARQPCRSCCSTCSDGKTPFPKTKFGLLADGAEAAAYIVRSGPTTQQDRWENQPGYTPFTLGCMIAALLVAAELADEHGEPGIAGLPP